MRRQALRRTRMFDRPRLNASAVGRSPHATKRCGLERLETRQLLAVWVLDDYDAGFSSTDGLAVGGWVGAPSYGEDHVGFSGLASNAAEGGKSASWTFSGLSPGIYQVSATWVTHANRSTGVQYAIRSGAATLSTVSVNQQIAPLANAVENDGLKNVNFQNLGGNVLVTEDTLTVEVFNRLDLATVNVDAMRLELVSAIPSAVVADDRDASTHFTSFATTGTWSDNGNTWMTFNGDRLLAYGGNGANKATWNFTNLLPGVYQIATTWQPHANRNSASAFQIGNTSGVIRTTNVNQQVAPQADITVGVANTPFQFLGSTLVVTSNNLYVTLSDVGAGTVVADAIHLQRIADLPSVAISDDRDAATAHTSFSTTGSWGDNGNSASTYAGDRLYASGGLGLNTATWSFTNLLPGVYRISTTWQPHPNNRNNAAPYSIYANGDLSAVRKVNQLVMPQADVTAGSLNTPFQDLHESLVVRGNSISVTLADLGPGFVVADAVRIERIGGLSDVPAKPENVRVNGPIGGTVGDFDIAANENIFYGRSRQRVVYSPSPAAVTGFEIWRSLRGAGTPDTEGDWEQVETLRPIEGFAATAVTRWGADVAAQRPFYYRVRAYNDFGFSEWSNVDRIDFVTHEEVSLMLSATVSSNPLAPSITLQFPRNIDSNDESYAIYRKAANASTWTLLADNSAGLTTGISSWTDTTVSVGQAYEYRVDRSLTLPSGATSLGTGYVLSGIEVPLDEDRGTVLLVVETTHAVSLANELARLAQDLVGDGWRVARVNVTSAMTPPQVKQQILAASGIYADLSSVVLIGNVAIPRSGTADPDGHLARALPADSYYGDLDGLWTDSTANYTTGFFPSLFNNTPGDGKFDQTDNLTGMELPELSVGRIDMSDMASFGTEVNLLRQYLDKNHSFRTGQMNVQRRGFVDDHWFANLNSNTSGEAKAKWAWRDFAAMFGLDGVDQDDSNFADSLSNNSYLWVDATSNGIGGIGDPQGLEASAQLSHYLTETMRGVFNSFVSSYSMEYERPNSFLNAPLADEGYGLVSFWNRSGDPHLHRMGLGDTIGEGFQLSRRATAFGFSQGMPQAYTNLLGDPTLRLHSVAPASNLIATTAVGGGVQLNWSASADAGVTQYYVYKLNAATGRFDRIGTGGAAITATNFVDATGSASADVYMVRAAKLERSGSGTYWNASLGVFSDVTAVGAEFLPIEVDTELDGVSPAGVTSLREALISVAQLGGNLIKLPAGRFTLTLNGTDNTSLAGDLDVLTEVKIIGAGVGHTIIDASGASDRAFHVLSGGRLTLEDLTVTGGSAQEGGGIKVDAGGGLSISNVVVADNSAVLAGGGIHNSSSDLTIVGSVITANSVTSNSGGGGGGGIYSPTGGQIAIGDSIVANNAANLGEADWHHVGGGGVNSDGANLIGSAPANVQLQLDPSDRIDPSADYIVTSPIDTNRTSPDAATLSLREAVMQANLSPGAEVIWLPAWAFELTVPRQTGSDSDAAYGDLDVVGNLVVRGVSNRTSIAWKPGIADRIFDLLGDYDRNNIVNGADLSIWSGNYGYAEYPNLTADGNNDGVVDGLDLDIWEEHFGQSGSNVPGDYNDDGMVDGADFLLWQANYGALWSPDVAGDGNDDGIVDGADFLVFQRSLGGSLSEFDVL